MGDKVDERNDVIDLSMPVSEKKRYRINGDNDKIIMLNVSDMTIISRMQTGLKELRDIATEISGTELQGDQLSEFIRDCDEKMRDVLNVIFDYDVASVCAPDGTMVDPVDGQFMYEHIIENLSGLYENNLKEEYQKMQDRLKRHTDKYTSRMTKRKEK